MSTRTRAQRRAASNPATPAGQPAKKKTQARRKPLPVRDIPEFMSDRQIGATYAAHLVGIPTRITGWADLPDGTALYAHPNGDRLTYQPGTRLITGYFPCLLGSHHAYPLPDASSVTAARVDAARCDTPHYDPPGLTEAELAELGLDAQPQTAADAPTTPIPAVPGDQPTESIPVITPIPAPRALADTLAHSDKSAEDTQTLDVSELRADHDQPEEHPTHD